MSDTECEQTVADERTEILKTTPGRSTYRRTFYPLVGFTLFFYIGCIGWTTLLPQYILARLRSEHFPNTSATKTTGCNINESDPLYLEEKKLERLTSVVTSTGAFCGGLPQVFMVLIYSSISDRLGRKVTIAIPYLGGSLVAVTIAVLVTFNLPFWVYYIAAFLNGFTGSYSTMMAGVFAMVADVTSKQQRSVAIGLVDGALGLAMLTANLIVGKWASAGNFAPPVIFLASLILTSGLFFFFIRETHPRDRVAIAEDRVSVAKAVKSQCRRMIATLFLHGARAKKLFLLTAGFTLAQVTFVGVTSVLSLYVMGQPFCWGSTGIGYYNALKIAIIMVGSTLALIFLRKWVSDFLLAVIGTFSLIAYNSLTGLATLFPWPMHNILMISGVAVGLVSTLELITLRGLLSKMVDESEQGAIFGLIAIGEVFSTSFGPVIMNAVYAVVVTTMKWFIFLLCVILLVIVLLFLGIYKGLDRSQGAIELIRTN